MVRESEVGDRLPLQTVARKLMLIADRLGAQLEGPMTRLCTVVPNVERFI